MSSHRTTNKALEWKARSGDPAAQYELACSIWRWGMPAAKGKRRAMKWYWRAAESGEPRAMAAIGEMFFQPDPIEGMKWIRKAAQNGHIGAQHFLGVQFAIGETIRRNPKEASYWYRKAARAGNAECQYNLGTMYWEGDGVPRNPALARKWISLAAENGEILAVRLLAEAYETGELGFKADARKARRWRSRLRAMSR